jgi:hypothetical protein
MEIKWQSEQQAREQQAAVQAGHPRRYRCEHDKGQQRHV